MSKRKNQVTTIRSSAAEYLTFIAASGEGGVEAIYADEDVWLTRMMMATLYDVGTATISRHLRKIFADRELEEDVVTRNFRITGKDGRNRDSKHYSLSATITVGYKVDSERAVQFRKWMAGIVKEYAVKAYVMDDERLKNDGSVLSKKYFEELLQRIREIRLSERRFYQKITDIYATSVDYDATAQASKRFFTTVQNKLHWAVHGQTMAEVIHTRADADKPNMGLTTWKAAPNGKIQSYDVGIARNYLTPDEAAQLQRLVSAYLDIAEMQAMCNTPMTMADWEERLNRLLRLWEYGVLQDTGKVSAEIAESHAASEFQKYRIIQDRLYESDFDRAIKATAQSHGNTAEDEYEPV